MRSIRVTLLVGSSALVIAAALSGCGSGLEIDSTVSEPPPIESSEQGEAEADNSGGTSDTSCESYLGLTPEGRMEVIAGMAEEKEISSDYKTLVSWELTALAYCRTEGGTVGQYVGPSSGLLPDEADPAAEAAGATLQPE